MFFSCSTMRLLKKQPKAFCQALGAQIVQSMWLPDLLDPGFYDGHRWNPPDKAEKCAF